MFLAGCLLDSIALHCHYMSRCYTGISITSTRTLNTHYCSYVVNHDPPYSVYTTVPLVAMTSYYAHIISLSDIYHGHHDDHLSRWLHTTKLLHLLLYCKLPKITKLFILSSRSKVLLAIINHFRTQTLTILM